MFLFFHSIIFFCWLLLVLALLFSSPPNTLLPYVRVACALALLLTVLAGPECRSKCRCPWWPCHHFFLYFVSLFFFLFRPGASFGCRLWCTCTTRKRGSERGRLIEDCRWMEK